MRLHAVIRSVVRWATRTDVPVELRTIEGIDLTPVDTWLLGAIGDDGPLRASHLADWQGVDKSTVTPQVQRLETAGLVARAPDPDDGRASLLSLTPKGRRVLRAWRSRGAQRLDELLTDWSPRDRDELARLLDRFVDAVVDDRHPSK